MAASSITASQSSRSGSGHRRYQKIHKVKQLRSRSSPPQNQAIAAAKQREMLDSGTKLTTARYHKAKKKKKKSYRNHIGEIRKSYRRDHKSISAKKGKQREQSTKINKQQQQSIAYNNGEFQKLNGNKTYHRRGISPISPDLRDCPRREGLRAEPICLAEQSASRTVSFNERSSGSGMLFPRASAVCFSRAAALDFAISDILCCQRQASPIPTEFLNTFRLRRRPTASLEISLPASTAFHVSGRVTQYRLCSSVCFLRRVEAPDQFHSSTAAAAANFPTITPMCSDSQPLSSEMPDTGKSIDAGRPPDVIQTFRRRFTSPISEQLHQAVNNFAELIQQLQDRHFDARGLHHDSEISSEPRPRSPNPIPNNDGHIADTPLRFTTPRTSTSRPKKKKIKQGARGDI